MLTAARVCAWILLPLLLLMGRAGSAVGQQPAGAPVPLTGRVLDAAAGTPVAGALVTLTPSGAQDITGSDGTFRFPAVAQGAHTLQVRAFGYVSLERALTVGAAAPPPLELSLAPDPVGLSGLTVNPDLRVTLSGVVRDARTGEPIPWVSLRLTPDAVRETAGGGSSGDGRFAFADVLNGFYFIHSEKVGYVTQLMPVAATEAAEVEVLMEPDSLVQAGLPVLEKELRARRNAFLGIAVAFGPEVLNRFERRHALDVVSRDIGFMVIPCERVGLCVIMRGRPVQAALFIDGRQVCGDHALDVLSTYRPEELAQVERFGPRVLRVYTHEYMERQARRQALDPNVLPIDIECPNWPG